MNLGLFIRVVLQMAIKKFKTYIEQINTLKKRKLTINDNAFAEKILATENYYNLINGYKEPFLDKRYKKERYKKNVSIDEIYTLYLFDRDLRNIFFKYILIAENMLRSLVAYNFSKEHGSDNYLKFSNFDSLKQITTNPEVLENRASKIHSLISKLQKDISDAISKKEYMNHYVMEYGYVPLWVLVNTISLGELSSFYTLMIPKERIEIAKYWNINEGHLRDYINNLSFFRNLCAHDERLYNARAHKSSNKKQFFIPDTSYHSCLNISKDSSGKYLVGKNDLFSLMIVLKILLDEKEFTTLYNKVNGAVNRLQQELKNISYLDIVKTMGFPVNWRDIKKP